MPLQFEADPTGFPIVWVEPIAAWMQWLPVTKVQFERFLREMPDRRLNAAWYDHLLALNPRIEPSRLRAESFRNVLLTGIVPSEAQRFAAWLGAGFAVPSLEQWRQARAALLSMPAERGLAAAIARRLEEPARTVVTRLDNALAGTTGAGPRRQRTLADQMLLRSGVLEWVEQAGNPPRWVGIGEPWHSSRNMRVSPERGAVAPEHPEAFRSYLFGFRLIRKP